MAGVVAMSWVVFSASQCLWSKFKQYTKSNRINWTVVIIWLVSIYSVQKVFDKNIYKMLKFWFQVCIYHICCTFNYLYQTTSSQNSFQIGPGLDYELCLLSYGQILFYFYLIISIFLKGNIIFNGIMKNKFKFK